MTAEDFLAWPGDGSGRIFQLVDGEQRPVSPASRTHSVVQATLVRLIGNAIESAGLALQVGAGMALQPPLNAGMNVRVPDVVVAPLADERGEIVAPDPVLVVEVLSPGNTDDTRDNIRSYANLPSGREMAVIHSPRQRAEIHRREADGSWAANPEIVEPGAHLRLATVALDIPLAQVYARSYLAR